MDHVVYVDTKTHELEKILNGSKTMIIRGAMGRKLPHGRVSEGDNLYFIQNNGEGKIKARAKVKSVFNSEKLTPEKSADLVKANQDKLRLDEKAYKRFIAKRYIILVEIIDVTEVTPFTIDRSEYGNMDDWLPVGDINSIKK